MMPVITVSKEYGSGGKEIAEKLAQVLNIDYFDKEIVEQVAAQTRVSTENVLDYEEERHISLRAYLSRVIDVDFLKQEKEKEPVEFDENTEYDVRDKIPFSYGNFGWIDSDIYREMIVRAISSLGQRQHVLIVGRGGQCILRDHPNAIHIRVVADFADRVERVMAGNGNLSKSKAEKLVKDMDKKSREYIKYYFKADWADPLCYNVVLNTSRISPDRAVSWLSTLAIEARTK